MKHLDYFSIVLQAVFNKGLLGGQLAQQGSATTETGIYVGMQQMEYGALASPHLQTIGPFSATGGPFSVAAGRVSYTFGFRGPAVSALPSTLVHLT